MTKNVDRLITNLTEKLKTELKGAMINFPKFNSSHEGYAVIKEEVDELWDEIKNNKKPGTIERQHKEALQIAAMAIRFIFDIK